MWNALLTTLRKFWRKKAKKFLLNVPNWKKVHTFFKKLFFLKLFLWTSRMQFWQPLQKLVGKRPKISCSKSQIDIKIQNFAFLLFVPMDKLKTVSTTSPKIFWWKAETNWLNGRKIFENFKFVERKRLRKKFLWRRRVGFWQPLQKFVGKRPEISCSKSQIDTKIQKVHFPSYFPYGQVENSLDNNAENFPTKGPKIFVAMCDNE